MRSLHYTSIAMFFGAVFISTLLLTSLIPADPAIAEEPVGWSLSSVDTARIARAKLIAVGAVAGAARESTVVFRPQMNFGKKRKRVQDVTFSVDECIKGICGDTLVFSRVAWGAGIFGRSGLLPDSTSFSPGERVVLLLEGEPQEDRRVQAVGSYKFPLPDMRNGVDTDLGEEILRAIRTAADGPDPLVLFERAPLVVSGTVVGQKFEHLELESGGVLLGYAVFRISETLKGTPPEELLRIRQNTDDGFRYQDPALRKGAKRVLFLRPGDQGRYEIVGRFWGAIPPEEAREALAPTGESG